MLSHEEQRLLDGMEQVLRDEDPHFTRGFDLATAQRRHQRRTETRIFILLTLGAFVLSTGVAMLYFDTATGSPIAALGCVILVSAVSTARQNPTTRQIRDE